MNRAIFLNIKRCIGLDFEDVSQVDDASFEHGGADSDEFDTLFMVSGRESAQPSPIITVPQPRSIGIQGFRVINPELMALARKLAT